MKYIFSFLLCCTVLAQQTVNNFAVKTNLTVSGSAYLNNPSLTNGAIFASVPSGFNQFPISGRGISGGINRTIKQYGYSVYQPSVTNRFVLDTSTSPYQYNHDSTLAYYDGKWYALWNANTSPNEGDPGQINLQSTSTDFVNWTTPVDVFNNASTSSNPLSPPATVRQWQPGLVNVGSELWCLWMNDNGTVGTVAGWQIYFSRLSSSSGKWTNTLLNLNYTEGGITFYGFPTQNPIQLRSGRVLAPLVWVATNYVSPLPPILPGPPSFWGQQKRSGVIYTDDNGATWNVGGATSIPNALYTSWEPVVQQNDDNTLRMYSRNLDYANYSRSQYLATAVGYADGASFDPLEFVSLETTSSRLGNTFQYNDLNGRQLYFLNDWNVGSFPNDRYNGAMAFSRTGNPDITPGINFSGSEEVVSYPQAVVTNNSVYVIYSQGLAPRNIKTAQITSAPDPTNQYVLPRSNDSIISQVQYISGPPAYFLHSQFTSMFSVTNTATWTATNASIGSWIYSSGFGGAIFDCRNLATQKGFLLQLDVATPKLSYYLAPLVGTNITFNTLTVPTNQWCYVGLTIDPAGAGATVYVVDAAGTATSQTIALTTHNGFDGGLAYIGRPAPGSTVGYFRGRIRHVLAVNGVSATTDNHRYWHGLDQVALGVGDWVGPEVNPGSVFYDYNAGAANAGSNDAAWLAAWAATGSTPRGAAFATTVGGKSAIALTGTGSAGVELPPFGAQQQLVWSAKMFITNKTAGYDQILLTIGGKSGQINILSRTNASSLIEAYSAETQAYYTLGSYVTNQWIPINVMFDRKEVFVSVNGASAVRIPTQNSTPTLFLGNGYLGTRNLYLFDGMAFDMTSMGVHVGDFGRIENPDRNPTPKSVTIIDSTPTLGFIDADAATTNTVRLSTSTRFNDYNGVVSQTTDFITGVNTTTGTAPGYKGTSVGTAPTFLGLKGNGTSTNITPTTSGQVLASFYGAGYGATNTEGTTSGGLIVSAAESFGSTNRGSTVSIQTTLIGTTVPATRFTVQDTGDITHQASAPIYNVIATNGNSGLRLNVTGGTTALVRFQTNGATVGSIAGDGSISFAKGTFTGDVTTSSNIFGKLATLTGDTNSITLNLSNNAPNIVAVATNGSSGLRLNVSGTTSFLLRLQTNNVTTHAFSENRSITAGNFIASVAGDGFQVKEGTNAKMGTAVLVAGTVTVSTTAVSATSRVFLTSNTDGGTPGWVRVSARVAGTSFTITSSSATDTSTIAWLIVDPAP